MSSLFIIFFTIFFSIYFGANYYVFRRARQALALYPKIKKYFSWVFWFLPVSFVLGRIVESWFVNIFTTILIWTGSLWMGALAYSVLLCFILDIIRLFLKIFKAPQSWRKPDKRRKFQIGLGISILVFMITISGLVNALFPTVRTIHIAIPKKSLGDKKVVRMIVASDIHLGTIVGQRRFNKLVEAVKNNNPDIVVFAGDSIDEDIAPVIKEDMGSSLLHIRPPLGFFGITGNHEYIGGVESLAKYLETHGVKMLRDEAIFIDNSFYLVGREDLSSERMGGRQRKTLDELFVGIPENVPVILFDHQPKDLKFVAAFDRVDLQVSGHTHNGQLWPFNFIVKILYEIPYGYGKINNTHFYISNGYGTWGPPLRVGNRPEILLFNLNFDQ